MSFVLIRYVLAAAFRDRLLLSIALAFVLGLSLAAFLGSSAVVEQDAFAATFAGSGLRMVGVGGLVLFTVFHIRRSFESRDIEFLLSRPISRMNFLASFAAGFSLIAIAIGVMEGGCLALLASKAFLNGGGFLWTASVIAENVIMANVALFLSMVLTSATAGTLAAFGFYLLARMMGEILGIVDTGAYLPWAHALATLMSGLSSLMPRLDLMGQSSWLVYGLETGGPRYGFFIAQGFFYSLLALTAAAIDLTRQKF